MPGLQFPHVKLVAGGRAGSSDSWSVGLTVNSPDAPSADELQAYVAATWTAWHNWWNGGSPSCNVVNPSDYLLDSVRAYYYAAGATSASVLGEYLPSGGINGAQDKTQPSEECLVVTLLSTRAGRHGRGRIYVPAGGGTLTNHQRTSDDCTAVATATEHLIEALNGVNVTGYTPGLVSIGSANGPAYAVSAVRVDSIPDVQRRRQFKMVPVATVSKTINFV